MRLFVMFLSICLVLDFSPFAQTQEEGSQVINVTAYGATGDGSTDDTSAIQAAINAAGSGNTVYFPHGNYCVNGGIAVSNPSVRLTGGSGSYGEGSNLRVCNGANVTAVTLQGAQDTIERLAIAGSSGTSITSPAVSVAVGASSFSIVFGQIANGYYALQLAANDGLIGYSSLSNAYGPAIVYATGSNHYVRNKIDQNFPVSTPGIASLPNPLPSWSPSTAYRAGDIVTSGGWLLQCKTGGTSGRVTPTLSTYGTDISDGAVVWLMVAPSTYYGMQLNGSVTATQIELGDFTGPYTAGLALTNSSSSNVPQNVKVTASNFGNTIPYNVLGSQGTALYLTGGNTFTNCLQVGCALVSFSGSWVGQSLVVGNAFRQGAIGVDDRAGQSLTIVGNKFDGFSTSAFHVAAGQSLFNFSDNDCSKASGGSWGINAACVVVDAGPSDHYIITNNLTFGATNGIIDNGVGPDKTVTGNQ